MRKRSFKWKIKKFHKNGTLWFNSLAISLLPLYEVLKDSLVSIQPYVSNDTYKYVGLAVVIFNIVLHCTRKDADESPTKTTDSTNT